MKNCAEVAELHTRTKAAAAAAASAVKVSFVAEQIVALACLHAARHASGCG